MKRDRRLASASSTNFDLAPADAADSETEHLRDGFLRGPPTREMQDVRAAIHLFPFCVDTIEEAPRMLLEHIAYAHCLDDVDTNLRAHKGNPQSLARSSAARRVLSQGVGAPDGEAVRGRALAAPSPPTAAFALLLPRGGAPGRPRAAHPPPPRATRPAPLRAP